MSTWDEVASLDSPLGPLALRRVWPLSKDHLLLEYRAPDGTLLAGQHLLDPARRADLVEALGSPPVPVVGSVVLQPMGRDRRLRPLARLCSRGSLVVHRPERRAVVRVEEGRTVRWAKVVRRSRLPGLVTAAEAATALLAGSGVSLAPLLEVQDTGVMWWGHVPGVPLSDVLLSPGGPAALEATGRAVAALHSVHANLPLHQPGDETDVLSGALSSLERLRPGLARSLRPLLPPVAAALGSGGSPPVVLHRDLHDKQVLLGPGVTLLDLDTLALGERELDVANLLVHLRLRALQGTSLDALALGRAFLAGYDLPLDPSRLAAYERATALRLACVYALRPGGDRLLPALAALAR